jgi:hypothetical protein
MPYVAERRCIDILIRAGRGPRRAVLYVSSLRRCIETYCCVLRRVQAKAEGIVTYVSNLFDTFFEGGKDHRLEKPSITHVPYFEGTPGPVFSLSFLCHVCWCVCFV